MADQRGRPPRGRDGRQTSTPGSYTVLCVRSRQTMGGWKTWAPWKSCTRRQGGEVAEYRSQIGQGERSLPRKKPIRLSCKRRSVSPFFWSTLLCPPQACFLCQLSSSLQSRLVYFLSVSTACFCSWDLTPIVFGATSVISIQLLGSPHKSPWCQSSHWFWNLTYKIDGRQQG